MKLFFTWSPNSNESICASIKLAKNPLYSSEKSAKSEGYLEQTWRRKYVDKDDDMIKYLSPSARVVGLIDASLKIELAVSDSKTPLPDHRGHRHVHQLPVVEASSVQVQLPEHLLRTLGTFSKSTCF